MELSHLIFFFFQFSLSSAVVSYYNMHLLHHPFDWLPAATQRVCTAEVKTEEKGIR